MSYLGADLGAANGASSRLNAASEALAAAAQSAEAAAARVGLSADGSPLLQAGELLRHTGHLVSARADDIASFVLAYMNGNAMLPPGMAPPSYSFPYGIGGSNPTPLTCDPDAWLKDGNFPALNFVAALQAMKIEYGHTWDGKIQGMSSGTWPAPGGLNSQGTVYTTNGDGTYEVNLSAELSAIFTANAARGYDDNWFALVVGGGGSHTVKFESPSAAQDFLDSLANYPTNLETAWDEQIERTVDAATDGDFPSVSDVLNANANPDLPLAIALQNLLGFGRLERAQKAIAQQDLDAVTTTMSSAGFVGKATVEAGNKFTEVNGEAGGGYHVEHDSAKDETTSWFLVQGGATADGGEKGPGGFSGKAGGGYEHTHSVGVVRDGAGEPIHTVTKVERTVSFSSEVARGAGGESAGVALKRGEGVAYTITTETEYDLDGNQIGEPKVEHTVVFDETAAAQAGGVTGTIGANSEIGRTNSAAITWSDESFPEGCAPFVEHGTDDPVELPPAVEDGATGLTFHPFDPSVEIGVTDTYATTVTSEAPAVGISVDVPDIVEDIPDGGGFEGEQDAVTGLTIVPIEIPDYGITASGTIASQTVTTP